MSQAVTAHEPAITVKRHQMWTPIAGEEANHYLQSGLCVKIRAGLGQWRPRGGTSIHKIENLHHMLLFAVRIRRHVRRVFKVQLDLLHGIWTFLWEVRAMRRIQDAAEFPQNAPDGAGGARQREALVL